MVCYECVLTLVVPTYILVQNQSYNNERRKEIMEQKEFRVVNHIDNP